MPTVSGSSPKTSIQNSMVTGYQVKLPLWEGPLDLLLDLIRRSKIDIFDIPIKTITQQYLDVLAQMKTMNIQLSASFLSMAGTLLWIKSRMLLPAEFHQDAIDIDTDPRQKLVHQLLEYQRYKEITTTLQSRFSQNEYLLNPQPTVEPWASSIKEQNPWKSLTLDELIEAFSKVMTQARQQDLLENLNEEEYSLEAKVNLIKQILSQKETIPFETLYGRPTIKTEVVIAFWAILELYKLGYLLIYQDKTYSDIHLSKRIHEGVSSP